MSPRKYRRSYPLNGLRESQVRAESGHKIAGFDQFHARFQRANDLLEAFSDIFLGNFRHGADFLRKEEGESEV